jgi:hypothetical protein
MSTLQIGDIVVGNNSWLNSMIGYSGEAGVLIHYGVHSSIINLFTTNQDIILMNDYVEKVVMKIKNEELKIGDLVELKPKIKKILTIKGVGTITQITEIKTHDFDGEWDNSTINACLVYFSEDDYEYTIPTSCLQLFSIIKTD